MGDAMHRDLLERHAVLRLLLYLVTIITALYAGGLIWSVLLHFGDIILLFFLAWVVCFILQPLSGLLERRGLPRPVAVTLIYLSLLGVACGSIVLAIPAINDQVGRVAGELTVTLAPANLATLAARSAEYLHRLGMSTKDAHALVAQVSSQIPAWTSTFTGQAVDATTSLVGAVFTLLFDTILVAMISFYMMLDGDRLVKSFIRRLPPAWHPDVALLQRKIEMSFGGFLRAQLILAVVYGALNGVILLALGQPNGFLFAVLAGLLLLLPFIGPFLAVLPPALLVMLQSSPHDLVRNVLIVVVAVVLAQQFTMKLLAPHVMSQHVGLHPLVLFAAILVGAQEGGVWGALFAAPVASVVVAMLDVFFFRFQQASRLYPEITPETLALSRADEPSPVDQETTLEEVGARDVAKVR
jgi:predicted PurR-regulated permease PerM